MSISKTVAFLVAAMVVFGLAQGAEAQVDVVVVTPAGYAAPATSGEQLASPPAVQLEPSSTQIDGVQTRANRGLVIGGIVTFGASYIVNMPVSVMVGMWRMDQDATAYMNASLVPLVGPWIQLGHAVNSVEVAVALAMGVAQAAGLAMFVAGLTVARTPVPEVQLGSARMTFTPTVTGDSAGLTAMGSF